LRYLLYCKIWRKRTKTKKKVSDEKNCFRFHWPYVPYTIHGGRLADGQQSIQVEHLVHKKLRRSVGFANRPSEQGEYGKRDGDNKL
jgi:hypothetical protein